MDSKIINHSSVCHSFSISGGICKPNDRKEWNLLTKVQERFYNEFLICRRIDQILYIAVYESPEIHIHIHFVESRILGESILCGRRKLCQPLCKSRKRVLEFENVYEVSNCQRHTRVRPRLDEFFCDYCKLIDVPPLSGYKFPQRLIMGKVDYYTKGKSKVIQWWNVNL